MSIITIATMLSELPPILKGFTIFEAASNLQNIEILLNMLSYANNVYTYETFSNIVILIIEINIF